jgi:7-cyano-7-deazaguanine synthase
MKKDAIVIHSGGMDSSLCLAKAIQLHGKESVLSLSFSYGQRHSPELERAEQICADWNVAHAVLSIGCLQQITHSALLNTHEKIEHNPGEAPNTLVEGRNGLMVRIASIHAKTLGATKVYTGVIEVESANSGYRDCSRHFMDLMQTIMRHDLDWDDLEIVTPVVKMTKYETLEFGLQLGVLDYLLENTITCYEGIEKEGCRQCPACKLRNEGIKEFLSVHPDFELSYAQDL